MSVDLEKASIKPPKWKVKSLAWLMEVASMESSDTSVVSPYLRKQKTQLLEKPIETSRQYSVLPNTPNSSRSICTKQTVQN